MQKILTLSKIKKQKEEKKITKKTKSKKSTEWKAAIEPKIIKQVCVSLSKIWKHCRPENILVRAKIGFSDPSYTGYFYALKVQAYSHSERYDINLIPVFEEEIYKGRICITGRIWIIYPLIIFIQLIITKPIRNIIFFKNK